MCSIPASDGCSTAAAVVSSQRALISLRPRTRANEGEEDGLSEGRYSKRDDQIYLLSLASSKEVDSITPHTCEMKVAVM